MIEGIGDRIKYLRKSRNLNQEEFVEHLDVTQGGISQIEKGESGISVELVKEISDIYNVSLEWLIRGKEDNTSPQKYLEQRIEDIEKQLKNNKNIDDKIADLNVLHEKNEAEIKTIIDLLNIDTQILDDIPGIDKLKTEKAHELLKNLKSFDTHHPKGSVKGKKKDKNKTKD